MATPIPAPEVDGCPECNGQIVNDAKRGERYCSDCWIIVSEDALDYSSTWHAKDHQEYREKSRVGTPTNRALHDKGLTTTIDWRNRDAYGNTLNARKRAKMGRLRTQHRRATIADTSERGLRRGLNEISRMASALRLQKVRKLAATIYRQADDADLIVGRSIEGVASAAIYAATRQLEMARSLDEVAAVSVVEKDEIAATHRYLAKELALPVPPANPGEFVPRIVSQLGLPHAVERRADELVKQSEEEKDIHSGRSPTALAAGAVYAATQLCDSTDVTQGDVAQVANVCRSTVQARYQEILEASEYGQVSS